MEATHKPSGQSHDIKQYYPGCWIISGSDEAPSPHIVSARIEEYETPTERFVRLAATANKFIASRPTTGVTVEVLRTENYLIVYSHTKGNHWNISGNHYYYSHNASTGEFIPEHECKKEPTLLKSRLLKADYQKLVSIYKAKSKSNDKSEVLPTA